MKTNERLPVQPIPTINQAFKLSSGRTDQVAASVVELLFNRDPRSAGPQGPMRSIAFVHAMRQIEELLRQSPTRDQPSPAEQIRLLIERSSNPLEDPRLRQQIDQLLNQPSVQDARKSYVQLIHETLGQSPELDSDWSLKGQNAPARSRRDVSFSIISLEAQKDAKALVEKGDSEMAVQYAAALTDWAISSKTSRIKAPVPATVANIPPYSTFGQAWSGFTKALKEEPFVTFARNNNIDTSNFRWLPGTGELVCSINGEQKSFTNRDSGWQQATMAVAAAAKALAPDSNFSFIFTGESSAPLDLVGDFYAVPFGSSPADRLYRAGQLQTTKIFESLRFPDADIARDNKPEYRHVRQMQRQTKEIVGNDFTQRKGTFSPLGHPRSPSERVEKADLELAHLCGAYLMSLKKETRQFYGGPADILKPPKDSTYEQLRQAFNKALYSEPFSTFAAERKIDVASVSVDPHTGELSCMVTGLQGTYTRTVFKTTDYSGWSAIAPEIWRLAKNLAAGSSEPVQNTDYTYPKVAHILNFYGENPAGEALLDILKQSSALTRNGFAALRKDGSASDERVREVKAKQRTVIQQLNTGTIGEQDTPVTATHPSSNKPAEAVNPTTEIARRQFTGEPDLRSVAGRLLSDAIKKASPGLDFNINQLAFAEPDPDNPGQFKRTPLMDLALDYLGGGDAPTFPGNSKLVDTRPDLLAHTGNTPDAPLPVDMKAVESAIRALPGQLRDALEADLLKYWDQPAFTPPIAGGLSPFAGSHRTLVSDLLRDNLRLAGLKQPGLDEQQRETLDLVVRYPKGSARPVPTDNSEITVFSLGSVSQPNQGSVESSSPSLLVQRHIADRLVLLLCEPNGKVTPYDSYAAFDTARKQQLQEQSPDHLLRNTLKKVDGDIFYTQAQTVIDQRLDDALATNPAYTNLDKLNQPQRKVPGWVGNATEAERFVLHELSLQLASISQRNKGRTYNSDILDIRPFAEQAFDNLKAVSHPAKNLEVVFKVPVGGNSPGGVVSGSIHRERMSMTDVLLRNLSGLPSRDVEVYLKPGNTRVPALEQDGALLKLIQDVDVGKNYPELLKHELLDDPAKKAERQSLFAQQVPVELQMKALELAVQKKSGLDTTGFRYVQAVVNPERGPKTVDAKEIVVRPLAFIAGPGATPDVVDNMYLIEPEDSATGPHILYRPLIADAPLLQFPTRQALLEAIQKPGRLQKDILAWFPGDSTREYYKAWSFKEPSAQTMAIFGVGDAETVPAAPTLAAGGYGAANQLKEKLQAGQLMNHLYDANAQGLSSIAEQQSVSDDESRWATLKEGGYLLLNAVLPALRGPGAAIGLALQFQGILSDLQTLADDETGNKEKAMADLLLSLATLLVHFRARALNEHPGVRSTLRELGSHSTSPIAGGRLSPGDVAPKALPSHRIQFGGQLENIKPLDGEIQTFVDTYNGAERINIIGHAAEPETGQPARIVGEDDKLYSAEAIDNELIARGVDIRKYPNARLIVCYSGKGGTQSLAADLNSITGVPVKGFEGPVTAEYDGVNTKDPFTLYAESLEKYKNMYPKYKKEDLHWLAENDSNKKLSDSYITLDVRKDQGTLVDTNIGTYKKPVYMKVAVDYRPIRFGPAKTPESLQGTLEVPVQRTSKELRSLSEYAKFKDLPDTEKAANSIEFTESKDAQFQYFLDGPENSTEKRLNLVGHGDKGGITFQSDLKGAKSYSPEEFAKLIAPLIRETGATTIRLVSCRSGQTGFAQQLSQHLNMPVKAPVGTVSQFEATKNRFWILEKFPNPRRPHDHEWKTFTPASANR